MLVDENFSNGFCSKRALKVFTIFFFLGLLTLNFVHSDSNSTVYPQITLNSNISKADLVYKPDYSKLIPKLIPKFEVPQKNLDAIWKLRESWIFFNKDIVDLTFHDLSFTVDLKQYVHNNISTTYTLQISELPSNLICDLDKNTKILNCSVKNKFVGNDSLKLELIDISFRKLPLTSDLILNFNILEHKDPTINPIYLNDQNYITDNQEAGTKKDYNLLNYILYPEDNLFVDKLISQPIYYYTSNPVTPTQQCNYTYPILSCNFIYPGSIKVQIIDSKLYGLTFNFDFNIIPKNEAPVFTNNLPLEKAMFAETYTLTNINSAFSDPNGDKLTYSVEKLSGDLFYQCESDLSKCTFNKNNGSGYALLRFTANDGKLNTPFDYKVTLVDKNQITLYFNVPYTNYNYKVVDGQAFDLNLKIKNNNNFDLYNLNLNIDNNLGLVLNNDFNLLANEEKVLPYTFTTPNNSTPTDYYLKPLINTESYANANIIITSIPYDANYLKDYFSILPGNHGSRLDGKNNYLPLNIKSIIPFEVKNDLDVSINLYVCKLASGIYPDKIILYNSENTMQEEFDKKTCYKKLLNPGIQDETIISKFSEDISYYPIIYLDTNYELPNTITHLDVMAFFDSEKSNNVIVKKDDLIFNFDSLDLLSSQIISPPSNTLLRDRESGKILAVDYLNGYAYSLVDIAACVRTAVWPYMGSITNYNLNNGFIELYSSNCNNINLKYNESGNTTFLYRVPGVSETIPSCSKIGDNCIGILSGIFVDSNFIIKGIASYGIDNVN